MTRKDLMLLAWQLVKDSKYTMSEAMQVAWLNKEITDNIIYLSLARKIKFAGEEEKESENG